MLSNGLDPTVQILFQSMESLAYALVNVTAFGLYTLAGLLLLPALFATTRYPRWLAWLGVAGMGHRCPGYRAAGGQTPSLATIPLLVSFALFAPWVWASGVWLLRNPRQ